MISGSVGRDYSKKNGMFDILGKIFWLGYLNTLDRNNG